MKHTKVTVLPVENKRSYGIKVETDKQDFIIPVIDVRDGEEERKKVNQMIKASNRSKYTQPSFSVCGNSYQVSHKKEIKENKTQGQAAYAGSLHQ